MSCPNEAEAFSPDVAQLYFADREAYDRIAKYYTSKDPVHNQAVKI